MSYADERTTETDSTRKVRARHTPGVISDRERAKDARIRTLEENVRTLEAKISSVADEREALRERNSELRGENKKLRDELVRLQYEVQAANNRREQDIRILQADLAAERRHRAAAERRKKSYPPIGTKKL